MPAQDVPIVYTRRLSDKIQMAFDQACRQGELEVAACMLQGLDLALLSRPETWTRRQEGLALIRALHARLADLRLAAAAAQNGVAIQGAVRADPIAF